MMIRPTLAVLLALSIPAAAAAQPGAALTRIGAAAAVAGRVSAKAPGAPVGRVLGSGQPVFLNDHVTTDAAGRMQVLLLDETVFTIGPNSDMVLDEFVYDPATETGKVSARVTKGAFRFVTGKVARRDPANMKVKLPVGTIGIRGTMAAGQAGPQGSTIVLLGPGARNNAGENPGSVSVENEGRTVILDRPGFGTTVAPGQPPAPPSDMSSVAGEIAGALEPQASAGDGSDDSTAAGPSASELSGQETAVAAVFSAQSGQDQQTSASVTENLVQATQQSASGIPNGLALWDHLRTIQSGLGHYDAGTQSAQCVGGLCSTGASVTVHFRFNIDWGNRTFGGGGSDSHIDISGIISAEGLIPTTSFSSLSGQAVMNWSDINPSQPEFNGSKISFYNRGGVAGKEAVLDLQYNGMSSETVTGTISAPYFDGPFVSFR